MRAVICTLSASRCTTCDRQAALTASEPMAMGALHISGGRPPPAERLRSPPARLDDHHKRCSPRRAEDRYHTRGGPRARPPRCLAQWWDAPIAGFDAFPLVHIQRHAGPAWSCPSNSMGEPRQLDTLLAAPSPRRDYGCGAGAGPAGPLRPLCAGIGNPPLSRACISARAILGLFGRRQSFDHTSVDIPYATLRAELFRASSGTAGAARAALEPPLACRAAGGVGGAERTAHTDSRPD